MLRLVRVNAELGTNVIEVGEYALLLGCGLQVEKGRPVDVKSIVAKHNISCVLLSDARLTTCGASPLLTTVYKGPIVATLETKCAAPKALCEFM